MNFNFCRIDREAKRIVLIFEHVRKKEEKKLITRKARVQLVLGILNERRRWLVSTELYKTCSITQCDVYICSKKFCFEN